MKYKKENKLRPVVFKNPDIGGSVVRARINGETYIFDPLKPRDYRRAEISQGYRGVLNGNIIVLLKDEEDPEPYRRLALESYDLRELLTGTEAFETLNSSPFQRRQARPKLFLGSRMLLGVNWEYWSKKHEYAHLIPWLELIPG